MARGRSRDHTRGMGEPRLIDRDIPEFRRVLEKNHVLKSAANVSDDDVREYFGHFYEFVLEDRELAFTPEYSSATVKMRHIPPT